MSEIITSAGSVGIDYNRSEGRVYQTLDCVVESASVLADTFSELKEEAFTRGRRRWVLRAVLENDARIELGDLEVSNNIEIDVPLSLIDPGSTRRLVILAENVHRSDVPEWQEVDSYWRKPYTREINPLQAVISIPEQFRLTDRLEQDDAPDLANIWTPFGWNLNGVREFINTCKENSNLWFSGVRNSAGRLISACQGEGITFGGIFLVEGTEYGTLPRFEGNGLCTAAVIGLHAQILDESLYRRDQIPLIYSELNLSVRSDAVARKTGMEVPLIACRDNTLPYQVLRRNVSVVDHQEPNDLSLEELGDRREHYEQAYGETFRFWRNFVAGILPREAIDKYYLFEQCQEIIMHYA